MIACGSSAIFPSRARNTSATASPPPRGRHDPRHDAAAGRAGEPDRQRDRCVEAATRACRKGLLERGESRRLVGNESPAAREGGQRGFGEHGLGRRIGEQDAAVTRQHHDRRRRFLEDQRGVVARCRTQTLAHLYRLRDVRPQGGKLPFVRSRKRLGAGWPVHAKRRQRHARHRAVADDHTQAARDAARTQVIDEETRLPQRRLRDQRVASPLQPGVQRAVPADQRVIPDVDGGDLAQKLLRLVLRQAVKRAETAFRVVDEGGEEKHAGRAEQRRDPFQGVPPGPLVERGSVHVANDRRLLVVVHIHPRARPCVYCTDRPRRHPPFG
ncbi:MAG: hypothetical protein IAE86_07295 [Burkholderiaceae bacterium]|nr:hypothetical protein [Burkholderiaceae bacterium]